MPCGIAGGGPVGGAPGAGRPGAGRPGADLPDTTPTGAGGPGARRCDLEPLLLTTGFLPGPTIRTKKLIH